MSRAGFPRSEPSESLPVAPAGNGFRPFASSDFGVPVTELFERAAREHHQRVAVVGSRTLTYRELELESGVMAQELIARNAPERVELAARCDVDFVVRALGTLRAGRAFEPLRAHTKSSSVERAVAHEVVELPRVRAGDLACVYATSGSTDRPLRVRIGHDLLSADVCRQTNDLGVGPEDRLDLLFSPAFSAALAPLFTALVNGASLHCLELETRGVAALPTWLAEHRITISNQSTSTLRALLGQLEGRGHLPDLRLLCVGGEPLRAADCRGAFARLHEACVLQNALAATETRTIAQFFVRAGDAVCDPVPVGHAVLGRDLELDPENGELLVDAAHMAQGYEGGRVTARGRFEMRADGQLRFHTRDRARFDERGRLIHLGRLDALVKIRGHGVDLAEVDQCVRSLQPCEDVLVVDFETVRGERAVGVILQVPEAAAPRLAELRQVLRPKLHDYALPTRVLSRAELPRNANGKVDRRAARSILEQEDVEPPRANASSASIEDRLAAIWGRVLALASVDRDVSFFEQGGDSLAALALMNQIATEFGRSLSLPMLTESPSVRALARLLDAEALDETAAEALHVYTLPRPSAGQDRGGPTVYLFPAISGHTPSLENLPGLSKSASRFHLITPLAVARDRQADLSIEEIATVHASEIESHAAGRPIVLVGFSFGAYLAQAAACWLSDRGIAVHRLALIDSRVPSSALPSPIPAWRRLVSRLGNLPAWIRYDLLESSGANLRSRVGGLLAERRSADDRPDLRAYFGHDRFDESFAEGFHARYQAALRFRPRIFRGESVVYRARAQSLRDPRPNALGWEHFVEPAPRVVHVAGHHESMLERPNVEEVVEDLDACLRAKPRSG